MAQKVLAKPIEQMVTRKCIVFQVWVFNLKAAFCWIVMNCQWESMSCSRTLVLAVRSAVSSCIASGSTLRLQVVRKKTVIWTNGQLETGTACFESTYVGMVKNCTRCYGAHLFSRDNGIKGSPLGYRWRGEQLLRLKKPWMLSKQSHVNKIHKSMYGL